VVMGIWRRRDDGVEHYMVKTSVGPLKAVACAALLWSCIAGKEPDRTTALPVPAPTAAATTTILRPCEPKPRPPRPGRGAFTHPAAFCI
jgi:hypothetical protein